MRVKIRRALARAPGAGEFEMRGREQRIGFLSIDRVVRGEGVAARSGYLPIAVDELRC